tara:strand:- start:384 stop:578 length:195 start_codon:yes stop_codon:yes gene_type:complete
MNRLLRRIEIAIRELDLGIPESGFGTDFLGTANKALRQLGMVRLESLEDRGALVRIALALESRV